MSFPSLLLWRVIQVLITYNPADFTLAWSKVLYNWGIWMTISWDWTKIIATRNNTPFNSSYSYLYQYTLSTPWDITTASLSYTNTLVPNTAGTSNWVCYSSDWTYLFFSNGNKLSRLTLSTPWDLSTRWSLVYYSWVWNYDIAISVDWTNLYVREYNINKHFVLSTPWDLSTRVYTSSLWASAAWPLEISDDWRSLYTWTSTSVTRYDLPTPYLLTWAINTWETRSWMASYTISMDESNLKFYWISSSNWSIQEYDMHE